MPESPEAKALGDAAGATAGELRRLESKIDRVLAIMEGTDTDPGIGLRWRVKALEDAQNWRREWLRMMPPVLTAIVVGCIAWNAQVRAAEIVSQTNITLEQIRQKNTALELQLQRLKPRQ